MPFSGITRSNTNQVVQSQKIVLKLGISDIEIKGFILSMKQQ